MTDESPSAAGLVATMSAATERPFEVQLLHTWVEITTDESLALFHLQAELRTRGGELRVKALYVMTAEYVQDNPQWVLWRLDEMQAELIDAYNAMISSG